MLKAVTKGSQNTTWKKVLRLTNDNFWVKITSMNNYGWLRSGSKKLSPQTVRRMDRIGKQNL